jgi:hypothetical protein
MFGSKEAVSADDPFDPEVSVNKIE